MTAQIFNFAAMSVEILLAMAIAFESSKRGSVNHVGYDIRWLYAIPTLHLLFIAIEAWKKHQSQMLKLIPALILALIIWSFDHFNILVEYNLWVKRGMPKRGDATLPRI